MTVGTALSRAWKAIFKADEGAFRPPPYYLPVTGGWIPTDAGTATNWWQLGYSVQGGSTRSALVEACISAYSQTIAMCPGSHWRANEKGGRTRVKNSALSRLLQRPNSYQSMSDFLLNAVRSLYWDGNAYALAVRNDRFEITDLHLMHPRMSFPQVVPPDGEIFYTLGGNEVVANQTNEPVLVVPQRDVLHIRLHNDRYPRPLIGETPLVSALGDILVGDAISAQQLNFYLNQARPSAVLSTDLQLDKDQVQALRDRWNEQSKGLNQGNTPILTSGLKVMPWSYHARDTMVAEVMKYSEQHIALAFRMPLQLLGLGGQAFGSTEALMSFWIATGLGFAINHVEESFGLLFALKGQPDEYVEFDTAALLRSAQKDRIEALARGVQGGIFSPNEARNQEGLDNVKFGDEPRVQQQVVPLSAASQITEAPKPGVHPPGPPAPPAPGAAPPAPAKQDYSVDVKREAQRLITSAARARRRLG